MASTASERASDRRSSRSAVLALVPIAVLSSGLLLSASCGRAAREEYVPRYGSTAAVRRQVLSFGVHPLHNPQRLNEVYGPLADYLSRHLTGVTIELEASRSYDEFEKKLAARSLPLALPNPYQTLKALEHGYRVFGKMGDDEKFRGIILVRKDSGIETVGDLRGKIVSFPAPTALAATMMPLYFLKTNGLDVSVGIQRLFVGSQESSIMSVFLRRSAAGATWPPPWESFVRAEPEKARQLVVKWETAPLVNNGLVARDDVPKETVDAIASLLFSLHTHEEGRALLAAIPLSRFEAATEATYEPVRAFLEKYREVVR